MFRKNSFGPIKTLFASALLVSSFAAGSGVTAHAAGQSTENGNAGALYTLTNAATGNAVSAFNRSSQGILTPSGTYSTGGLGSGNGLGSQGAVVLSENNRWLFAVNAGSNDVSAFEIEHASLELVDRVASGGIRPISLTESGDVLYVLNAGGNGNISGFTVRHDGHLSPIAGSTRPLSGNATGPAQVQFDNSGRLLAVTEKNTNMIDIYTVGKDGTANGPTSHPSSGTTPFGFAFGKQGKLIISEASGGAPNASSASSYEVGRNGSFNVVTASSPDHQTAACWLVLTDNERYAYTANTASDNISGYRVNREGNLSLLDADGVTGLTGPGTHPTDLALSNNSRYLYSLNAFTHSISAFEVRSDGSLAPIAGVGGLSSVGVGLAGR